MTGLLTQLKRLPVLAAGWIKPNIRLFRSMRLPLVWALAIVIGVLTAIAAILFRMAIGAFQWLWLGTSAETVITAAAIVPWWVILLAPTLGGLCIGVFLQTIQPKQRTGGVPDVIEARVQGGRGLPFWPGISSAFLTSASLGCGASAGREGPVVHLGATIGTALCQTFRLPDAARRMLLACGVASAVSASFNAPIAGVLFAHEVILGHYAMTAFVPIVIASVLGTLMSRLWFGDIAAFSIPEYQITSMLEMPAFALLGLTCAAVAVIFQFSLIGTDWVARNISMPLWLRPVIGGLAVGAIGIAFPGVLGVGYEATDLALRQELPLVTMLALLVAKTAATSITLASRFGGGIFSPALYLGAMTGGAFGLIAAAAFPELASSHGLYAILGMGAVAAAVLGAPFSTTMIVFELTGGYALSIALLIAVSIATGLTQAVHGRSFFHWQLEMRGVTLQEGAHKWLVRSVRVSDFVERPPHDAEPQTHDPATGGASLKLDDTLEAALKTFDESGTNRLPVVDAADPTKIIGHATHVRALRFFNAELINNQVEEHR